MKRIVLSFATAALLAFGALNVSANHHGGDAHAPMTVIHVVTVSWKAEATPEQIQAAMDGVKDLAKNVEGITRVWVKTISAQGDRSHAFVMEFASQKALVEYSGSAAQKAWYDLYLPIRERSTTFDIGN
jgi:hypothetical protein